MLAPQRICQAIHSTNKEPNPEKGCELSRPPSHLEAEQGQAPVSLVLDLEISPTRTPSSSHNYKWPWDQRTNGIHRAQQDEAALLPPREKTDQQCLKYINRPCPP